MILPCDGLYDLVTIYYLLFIIYYFGKKLQFNSGNWLKAGLVIYIYLYISVLVKEKFRSNIMIDEYLHQIFVCRTLLGNIIGESVCSILYRLLCSLFHTLKPTIYYVRFVKAWQLTGDNIIYRNHLFFVE